jgi:hypothetical protein
MPASLRQLSREASEAAGYRRRVDCCRCSPSNRYEVSVGALLWLAMLRERWRALRVDVVSATAAWIAFTFHTVSSSIGNGNGLLSAYGYEYLTP